MRVHTETRAACRPRPRVISRGRNEVAQAGRATRPGLRWRALALATRFLGALSLLAVGAVVTVALLSGFLALRVTARGRAGRW